AYMDVLAACPSMVGGQGPCSQTADQPLFTEDPTPKLSNKSPGNSFASHSWHSVCATKKHTAPVSK
ncbi:hypothetical protein NEH35_20545, partial [Xanthomonas hortorum pv. pelargonii]|nr:hypothetical protein [Xanthomonas hortorum pv. pelargonii]